MSDFLPQNINPMDRFFVATYRFFAKHKWLMYTTLVVTSIVFVYFGLQVKYEEDISKLLPQTEQAEASGVAFGNLRVKDKISIQIVPKNDAASPEKLAAACDEFVDGLLAKDSATDYIANVLYRIDDDLPVMALDYALMQLPTFVDTACYASFSELLMPEAIFAQMQKNVQIIAEDEDGTRSDMVAQDPVALRRALLPEGKSAARGLGGFAVVDRHFFAPDSTVVLAFLSPNFKSFDSKSGTALVEMIESEITDFNSQNADYEVLFHGSPVQSVFNSRQIKKDLAMTMSVSLVLICLVVGLCLKRPSNLLMMLCPVIYGAFFALACMYWLKGGMSLLAIGIGAIVLGVALSYCLHVLIHSKYVSDPEQLLRDQSTPVCLSCITTIGAFAGLLFTQSELLKDFGLFASFALIGTTLCALIFLPHFFSEKQKERSERAFALLDKINSFPLDRQKWLIVAIIILCGICFYTSTWVSFDSDLKHIGYNEPVVMRSKHLYEEKVNQGRASVYYAASASDLDEALMCSRAVVHVCDSLQQMGIVARYSGVSALFFTIDEQQARIDAWHQYWTDDRIAKTRADVASAAKQNGLQPEFFEPFFALLEADYEPASLYDAGVLPESLLSNFIEKVDDNYLVFTSALMDEQDKERVSDAVAAVPHAVVIDPFYYTGDMVKIVNSDFNVVLLVSSIFVFIVLLFSFRSLSRALLAFLPMFLSWYVVQGIMGIFGMQFNLINIIISSFIFGVGVDYSIFVMDGLLADTRRNDPHMLTYHKTAIFFSAFVLIVVVVTLLFATHPALKSVGISTLIGMVSTILFTYTLQPCIFRLLAKSHLFARRFARKPRFGKKKEE